MQDNEKDLMCDSLDETKHRPCECKGRSAEDFFSRSSVFFRHDLKYSSILC